ncbi:HD-GYP domain-containing protein [Paenibacillus sp. MMO-177]|uniref:HD-GYP domain-containing protein n=1 Tax=Paenibacillus sp. MMO-177 TaxID=3081289 RepID=UPI003017FCC3
MLEDAYSLIRQLPPYAYIVLLALLLTALTALFITYRHYRVKLARAVFAERIVKLVQPEAGLENNLNLFLETIGQIVDADGYAFYIRDPRSSTFVLKAVRHRVAELGQVAPSYSGLAPYKKEVYLLPMSIQAVAEVGIVHEGEVPLFNLPVGDRGLVRIGPIERTSSSQTALLRQIGELLPSLLDILAESDRLNMKADVVESSSAALQAVSSMAKDPEAVVQKAFSMSAIALGMSGGCVLVSDHGTVTMPVFFGWSRQTAHRLADTQNLSLLIQLISPHELVMWDQNNELFERMRDILGTSADSLYVAGQLPMPGKRAWFICGFPRISELTAEQMKRTVSMMTQHLSQLMGIQEQMKTFSHTYSEFLKLLARTIDELNPYTVGYSEMMSRYSVAIAKEMGLPAQQIRAIGTAAYLSNIGVLGLPESLYLKEGKFTEVEFEKMKLHTEVGASIVEMTIGNKEIAESIRYHHERMDGNGYPSGLKGEEIPIGARIISVVQTFLAKINGRKYRDPLPFDKAMKLVESLAGSQLDSEVVRVFIRWFEEKRRGPQLGGRALGACWDMSCSPSNVCRVCPAYNREDVNCWDVQGNNCHEHGKSCSTCFVYTETLSRS